MKKHLIASMIALPLAVSAAYAQDTSALKISGFGTAALTWANTDSAEFARPNQASGVKKDPRTGVDSNLGLQADYTVNSWLSVTGQGLVRKDGEDDYGAELSWAFVKAKLSDKLSMRVGRMALPAFMISDYRNVGYANTFLRPPSEVYSQMPLNSIDGADLTWRQEYAGTTYTAQVAYGRSSLTMAPGIGEQASREYALNLTAERGPFTLRVGRSGARISVDSKDLDGLVSAMNMIGKAYNIGQLNDMAALMDTHNKKYTFTSVGLGMDWNNIVAQTEFAKREMPDSFAGASKSWYVMGGYRFGKFLPYYSHAKLSVSSDFNNTIPTSCPAGSAAACTTTLIAVRGFMEAVRTGTNGGAQSTDSIGLRWDFMPSADLKFQIDRVKPAGDGLFVNAKTGFKGPVTVGAVAVDFVF
jgi:hypothetical protein